MDREAWCTAVDEVAKSRTWLSDWTELILRLCIKALYTWSHLVTTTTSKVGLYTTPGFPVLHYLPELAQIHVHWVGDAIQPSHPLSSPSPAFILPSIRVFSNESALHIRLPNYWSFRFSISPSNVYSGLISFRIDWLDLLAVQVTLKSLFQWVNSSHDVAKVLEFQLQHHSLQRNPRADLLQNWLVGSPCSPRDSQESSPTPKFISINSSVLNLLHSPTLTSIHDFWKNHSLD